MIKISFLMPTRARPEKAMRFLNSIVEQTESLSSVEVISYIDSDDESSQIIQCPTPYLQFKKLVLPQTSMGKCNTTCLKHASGEVIILINDDVIIRTPQWDTKLLNAAESYPDGIYLLYTNDLFKGKKLPAFPILSKKTCELLENPFPSLYQGAFIDVHLFDIFKRLKYLGYDRIQYLQDIVFEHMHYRLNKSTFDDTYRKRNRFGDDWIFVGLAKERQYRTQQLISFIKKISSPPPEQSHVNAITINTPQSFLQAFLLAWNAFMRDHQLAFIERIHLFSYQLSRFIYAKLIKKTAMP